MWSTAGISPGRPRQKSAPSGGCFQFEPDIVLHAALELAEQVEGLAEQAVAVGDRVVDGAGLGLVQDRRRALDGIALRLACSVADRQRDPRGVADPLDLPGLLDG